MSLLAEWVEKAEGDYKSAMALQRRRKEPLPDIVCYHCQQCVEKYLKAYLIAQGSTPPRIHDLADLLNLCVLHDATLTTRLPLVQILNPYAMLIRYPGMTATVAEAKEAVDTMRRLRAILRRKLGCKRRATGGWTSRYAATVTSSAGEVVLPTPAGRPLCGERCRLKARRSLLVKGRRLW